MDTEKKVHIPNPEERKKLQEKLDQMTRDFSKKLQAEAEKVGVSLEVIVRFQEQSQTTNS